MSWQKGRSVSRFSLVALFSPMQPEQPALSSECLWLGGSRGFGSVLHRARFGGGGATSRIEKDGDEHVAHDVHARARPGDDPAVLVMSGPLELKAF
ncbi:MAG: hypothetical protein KJS98_12550 [Nitrospirae bacterium]|nr:hypothetical protein [Nitrospirota bacterium]MDE3217954.1 hypothetical protein [Nitrospirota bacterium]